jgi:hypothetical protein
MKKLLLIFFAVYYSCNEKRGNISQATIDSIKSDIDSNDNKADTNIQPREPNLYAIQLNDTNNLSLQQWDSTINLQHLLGKPLKQKTRKLDQNSDTFSGSCIKDVEYDGLKLQLFSPPQNGKTFWIQEIILTNDKYKTTKGVTLGDEWQRVKDSYPTLKKFPGENENMYYVADEGYEKSIEMEFEKNKLQKLRMYYLMN